MTDNQLEFMAAGTQAGQAFGDKRQWYSIRNAAKTDTGPAELLIYDEIDSWFGVSAERFATDVAKIDDSRELVVRINSPGGNVFDGIAILNALRAHKGKVTTIVDGIAASAASFIAMAGDEIVMNQNSEMMVHNPHGIVMGGIDDMRKMAENLERIGSNIASIYADKAGGSVDDWLAIMADETWYSADEAVTAGLADRVTKSDTADAKAKFNLAIFNHAGRSNAPAPRILAHQTPQPAEAEVTEKTKEGGRMPTLQEGLAELIGIAPDADDETILAAAKEALQERAAEQPAEPVEPTVEQVTQVAAKYGLTVVDSTVLDSLQAKADAGEAARAQQLTEGIEADIQAALQCGQITPASVDTWRNSLRTNPEQARALLATIPKNHALAVSEVGHGVSNDQPIDAEMAAVFAGITGKDA